MPTEGESENQAEEIKYWHLAANLLHLYKDSLRAVTFITCFMLMWALLGLLLSMGSLIIGNARHNDPALEWTFS
jgi:hypothetical protein